MFTRCFVSFTSIDPGWGLSSIICLSAGFIKRQRPAASEKNMSDARSEGCNYCILHWPQHTVEKIWITAAKFAKAFQSIEHALTHVFLIGFLWNGRWVLTAFQAWDPGGSQKWSHRCRVHWLIGDWTEVKSCLDIFYFSVAPTRGTQVDWPPKGSVISSFGTSVWKNKAENN